MIPAPQFPYLLLCGVLPAALLTAAGIFPLAAGLLLLAKVGRMRLATQARCALESLTGLISD